MRADAVQEDTVKAAVTEVAVIDGDDIRYVLRMRRTVETETFSGRQVVIGRDSPPQIDGRNVVTDFFGLSEYGQPEQHPDALRMQVLPHFPVDILVQAPADDDLPDRDEAGNSINPADDLRGRIIRRMPAAQGHLDDIAGLRRRLGLTGCKG